MEDKSLSFILRIFMNINKNEINKTINKIFIKIKSPVIWNTYLLWKIKKNEPSRADLKLQSRHLFSYHPKISIVIPLYNTSLRYFKELFFSVQAQTYNNWELCLADGSLKKNKKIEKLCAKDKRIHYRFLGENKGISGITNEAIKLAAGDYIAFMDHNDALSPFALYENVKRVNEQPDVEFIYSDEDSLIYGKRRNPVLKPDFAPDTLRSVNYIGHFFVMKRSLTERLGNFNSEYDGAQDYDYVLRASEATTKIYHIKKILYHRRYLKTNDVLRMSAKALEAHIARIGFKGTVKLKDDAYYPIYNVIGTPSVSIIIPSKDFMTTLKTCVDSILERTTYKNYEIVIIENNSEKEKTFAYYRELEKHPQIRVLYYPEKEFNYPKLINFGVKNCSSDYIVQLNNDTEIITPDWLELMLGLAQRPDVGAVGAKLLYPDRSIQHAGIYIDISGSFILVKKNFYVIQNCIALIGACVMSRRKIYEQIGYMDQNLAASHNDVDFCLALRNIGLYNVFTRLVEIIHHEGKTRGYDDTPEKENLRLREWNYLVNKWPKVIRDGEPYFRAMRDHA